MISQLQCLWVFYAKGVGDFQDKTHKRIQGSFGNERGNLAEAVFKMILHIEKHSVDYWRSKTFFRSVLNYVDDTLYSMSFFVFLLTV